MCEDDCHCNKGKELCLLLCEEGKMMNNTCTLCEDEERMTAYDERCKRLCEEDRKMEASDCLCKNGKCEKTCKLSGQNCPVQLSFLS